MTRQGAKTTIGMLLIPSPCGMLPHAACCSCHPHTKHQLFDWCLKRNGPAAAGSPAEEGTPAVGIPAAAEDILAEDTLGACLQRRLQL